MHTRLKKVRTDSNLTQQEFADRLKVKRGTIANYELGRNEPIDAVITLICREFDVSEEWLRTGKGEMHPPIGRREEIASFVGRVLAEKPESFKQRFLAVLLRLDEDDWEVLEKMALMMAEEQKKD